MSDDPYARQLRAAMKQVVQPHGYKVARRWSFVSARDALECAITLLGSRQGGGSYRVAWGVVVPALVEPLWLVKYTPGEPELGCLFDRAVRFGKPGELGATVFRAEDSAGIEEDCRRVQVQAECAVGRMSGIETLDDLRDAIENKDPQAYWFPFGRWPPIILGALTILQHPDSYDDVVASLEMAALGNRGRAVLESLPH